MDKNLGELLVPENRRRPGSRVIALRFRRLGPLDGRPVLFHFTGGPGMSNLKHRYPEALLETFTVVEVGYRGIDSSTRLRCDGLKRQLTAQDLLSDGGKVRMARAFDDCVRSWQAEGLDLSGYQLADMVEDAEDLRRALGVPKVHLVADSYGTRLALEYLSRHPESVVRAVLIGANPPGHFFWSSSDLEAAFAGYERATGTPGLEAAFHRVLMGLPERSWGLRVDPDRIRIMSFFLLFHRSTARRVFTAFSAAHEKNSTFRLVLLSLGHNLVLPHVMDEWGDLFWKGLITDWHPDAGYRARSAMSPGRFGSPLGELLFAPPYDPDFLAYRDAPRPLAVTTPTLVLSGALDFSTPPENARRELVERFPSVQQLVVPSYGHVADFWAEPRALSRVLEQYLLRGRVPEVEDLPDRSAQVPRFVTRPGFKGRERRPPRRATGPYALASSSSARSATGQALRAQSFTPMPR